MRCKWCGVERDVPAVGPHACDPANVPKIAGPWEAGGPGEMYVRRSLDHRIIATTLWVTPKHPHAPWRVPVATSDRSGADSILREHGWLLATGEESCALGEQIDTELARSSLMHSLEWDEYVRFVLEEAAGPGPDGNDSDGPCGCHKCQRRRCSDAEASLRGAIVRAAGRPKR